MESRVSRRQFRGITCLQSIQSLKEKGRQITPAAHTFREVGTLPVKATIGSNDPSRSRVDQKYIVIMTDIGLVATGLR